MEKHFQENEIIFTSMGDEARKQFDAIIPNLDKIEHGFYNQMGSNSLEEYICSLIITSLWGIAIWLFRKYWPFFIPKQLMIVTLVIMSTLVGFMFFKNLIYLLYYGKIDRNRERISQIKKQVQAAKNDIDGNEKLYMEAAEKNWDYPLRQADSIPEQIKEFELIHNSYQILENGWLERIIILLFFSAVFMVTVSTGYSLTALSSKNCSFLTTFVDYEIIIWVCRIALVLTCITEEAMAWFWWRNEKGKVNNLMLTILLIAPVVYLFLSVVLSGIVYVAVGLVTVVLVTLYYIVMFGCALMCCSASAN